MAITGRPATDIQTFEDIIRGGLIYVDKTAFLAKMLDTGIKTWFLARPRRFGKSLTVTTFKAIFSGKKELFKDMAIEKRLGEEKFASRPVIHLDMSKVESGEGPDNFKKSLSQRIHEIALNLEIDLPLDLSPSDTLSSLIFRIFWRDRLQAAVLIDEYDAPITNLIDKPSEAEKVRALLHGFFKQLKANDKYLSFVFVTGITKYLQGGPYSGFNNHTDISLNPKYATLTGFTHEEIKSYYGRQIKEVAETLKVTEKKLLDEMKNYYNGFCFDGKTLVYNPFSTAQFFKAKT
ncbi:MAG: AAA family ATPase, partial [Deltaproteobacteria bacterium]|nr:AAA family ATPase [Deltaproteobacteria bacterium]